MLLANFDRKEHLQHRAVSLRQHGFLVQQDSAPVYIGPAAPSNCFSRRHWTSSVLTSRRQTHQIWTLSTARSGKSCSSVYINAV